jgi:hypothetical protein
MSFDNFNNKNTDIIKCFGLKNKYKRSDCITSKDWERLRCESNAEFSTFTQGSQIYLCSKCSKRGLIGIAPYMICDGITFMTYGLSERVPL